MCYNGIVKTECGVCRRQNKTEGIIDCMKRIIALILVFAMSFALVSCYQGVYQNKTSGTAVEGATNYVQIEMEDGGIIKIELYPDIAPITVANFQKLVSEGFYDGLTFHRVIYGFMIQCGDPTGTGMGGSDETIKGEFAANGIKNNLSHTRGVVSMGRKSSGYDTASSHFFIMHADYTGLDGQYAAFGKVYEGMDVVDAIASVKTNSNDKPLVDQKIKTITFTDK